MLASGTGCLAADIRPGATMHVKPNSIWFDDAAKLTQWQRLKKSGDATALATFEKETLGQRDAWQFIYRLAVKVRRHDRPNNQVEVEMKTPGRFQDSTWMLDAGALTQ